jgi:predicted TIM-barrel fold metal-dependent hydrolase
MPFLYATFSHLIEDSKMIKNGDIIGVKLYPPMMSGLYSKIINNDPVTTHFFDFCKKYDIPITIHCSKDSYNTNHDGQKDTNPGRFIKAMKEIPSLSKLRINFAHSGGKIRPYGWSKKVAKLINENDNMYMDISAISHKKLDMNILRNNQKMFNFDKILPGSDYSLSLLNVNSYSDYISTMLNNIGSNLFWWFSRNVISFLGEKIISKMNINLED